MRFSCAQSVCRLFAVKYGHAHATLCRVPILVPFPLFGCSCTLVLNTLKTLALATCWFTLHFQLAHPTYMSSSASSIPFFKELSQEMAKQILDWWDAANANKKTAITLNFKVSSTWAYTNHFSEESFWIEERRSKKLLKNVHAPNIIHFNVHLTILHQC